MGFVLYLKHTPDLAISVPSTGFNFKAQALRSKPLRTHLYLSLNTPPHLAIPVRHISQTRPLVWGFRLILYILNTPPQLPTPVHHILNTRPHLAIPVHHLS